MKRRGTICLIIFGFGVLMILSRPYLVYAMTSGDIAKSNPTRTWRLLQRLIKKKDDHHEYHAEPAIITAQAQAIARPVRKMTRFLYRPVVINKAFSVKQGCLSKTLILAQRHRYLILSCFLI